MEPRYLWILDYSCANGVIVIRLSDKQLKQVNEEYENDLESFIRDNLEQEYHFRLKDCEWMITEDFNIETYGF